MISGEGFGKIILFGEHFVVHGATAIALGISNKSIIKIEKSEENEIITDFPVMPNLSKNAIEAVERAIGIKEKFKVYFDGNLPITGGLGSSAAFCVALARAFSSYYNLNLNNEKINEIANQGEKVFHGNPSGIDNTVATFGGAIKYKKGVGFEHIKLNKEFFVVIGITGKHSPTKKMVEKVSEYKKNNDYEFNNMMEEIENIILQGEKALKDGNLEKIAELMNENQILLNKIGVSDKLNDKLIKEMLSNGALGAKLTGGGGGGCCIAIAKNENHAKKILESLSDFRGFVSKII